MKLKFHLPLSFIEVISKTVNQKYNGICCNLHNKDAPRKQERHIARNLDSNLSDKILTFKLTLCGYLFKNILRICVYEKSCFRCKKQYFCRSLLHLRFFQSIIPWGLTMRNLFFKYLSFCGHSPILP